MHTLLSEEEGSIRIVQDTIFQFENNMVPVFISINLCAIFIKFLNFIMDL